MVVGGGNSAVEEAIFLTKFASKVNIAYRGMQLTASAVAHEMALANPKISVHYETVVAEFRGKARLSSVVIRNTRTGETKEVPCSGVFVFIGLEPNTKWLKGSIELDDIGFIVTDSSFRTNVSNVFAAGDARKGSTKQLVSAAGEGGGSRVNDSPVSPKRKSPASQQKRLSGQLVGYGGAGSRKVISLRDLFKLTAISYTDLFAPYFHQPPLA